jgi:hypothetical protein
VTFVMPKKTVASASPDSPPQYSKVMKRDPLSKVTQVIDDLGDEADALGCFRNLQNKQVLNYVAQGGVLLRMKKEKWLAGYASFDELCQREFGCKKSHAYDLMRVYKALRDHDVSWDEVKSLDWQRLKLVCGAEAKDLDVDAFSTRVEKAKRMTPLQLRLEIKGAPRAETSNRNKLILMLDDEQLATVKAAIAQGGKDARTSDDAVALDTVCLAYLRKSNKAVLPPMDDQKFMLVPLRR